ncbi:MAG TPA: ATP-binding protein, partial [Fimbriimonadaceae bacterium]|nr:ATP-binding protein [Fimbriimonadaceae bacterium]
FTYTISHDLRQALRGILTNVQMLEHPDEPHSGKLDRIQHNAQQLNHILEDLLDMRRLARCELRPTPTDLTKLARQVSEWLYQSYPDRRDSIEVQPGLTVTADQKMLRRVCEELLDNALKFSPPTAKVHVGALEDGLTFFIRNQGPGFDPQYRAKIFEPFERLENDYATPGTGIGLAKALRIVRRHGGRIWAESEPGESATFYFSLNPLLL